MHVLYIYLYIIYFTYNINIHLYKYSKGQTIITVQTHVSIRMFYMNLTLILVIGN